MEKDEMKSPEDVSIEPISQEMIDMLAERHRDTLKRLSE